MNQNIIYYAHTTDGPKDTWQTLLDHLHVVAGLARDRAEYFKSGDFAYWAGIVHDIGKFSMAFQDYLESGRGRVDHSTAGAQLIKSLWERKGGSVQVYLATLLSYIIAGHHGGLPDGGATAMDSGSLMSRLAKKDLPIYDAWEKHVTLPSIPTMPRLIMDRETASFTLSFWVRMLFSSLTDSDFLDTEHFCDPGRFEIRGRWPSLEILGDKLDAFLEQMLSNAKKTPVNAARLEILNHCNEAARKDNGVFSLTVPTGGGKTLSSLSFAMKHARTHALRRIIYVIPYTSIIEQNAEVFRNALGDDAVLEHHCNYIHPDEKEEGGDEHRSADDARRFRLAMENWDTTLVVTTAVQFFESLFANRSSRCRKLHNIANSVVILDEAQMLPLPLLQPSVMALRELAYNYNVSLVLCTATQPALSQSGKLSCGFREGDIREIIPQDRSKALFKIFSRTRIINLGKISDTDLVQRMRSERQVLAIVNTRNHARQVFQTLGKDPAHFHLSARMYPEHRSEVLEKIRQRLKDGLPCRVVSTSLIECGVDVDFPAVFRAFAGLDSIAQAAGRCNREGELEIGYVYIFLPETGMPKRAPGFQRRAEVFQMVSEKHRDLFSPEAVNDFFTTLYRFEGLDQKGIMRSLSEANKGTPFPQFFPFCKMASSYRFIENNMVSVIVERGETARKLVGKLEYAEEVSGILRQLQAYTVQIYSYELDALLAGGVELVRNQFYVARGGIGYREDEGLCSDDPAHWEAGEGII
ncbi:MAG: CRISPR-associated helicase Cas3' [Desulfobacteraceae bacterium]|nr:CRISPR-associated helicase Cas3' [Desulfobacteraceae bacterium]